MTKEKQAIKSSSQRRGTWQARKSAETQVGILDAAVDSYIDVGFGNTTLQRISDQTGLSRGAIIYHFPSMKELTLAAIRHLVAKRLTVYRETLEAIPEDADFVDAAVESFWLQVTDPLFTAYIELAVGARTDPELAAMLRPAQEEYEQEWHRIARAHSHAARDDDDRFNIASDLAENLLTGLATTFMSEDGRFRRRRMVEYAKIQIRTLLEEGPDKRLGPALTARGWEKT